MQKIDATVKRETQYIAAWVVILSVIMEAVFLIIGRWDYTVILGNLLSGTVAIVNFLLMGITIQKAVEREEKEARGTMRMSQSFRTLAIFVIVLLGVSLPCFNIWASIIPLLFPRIAIAFRGCFNKNE